MKTTQLLGVAGCLLVCMIGCDEKPAASKPAPQAASQTPVKATEPHAPAMEPEYAVEIAESAGEPRQYTVNWSAKVNTGGWTMKTDSVLVEELNGMMACRIWVTLEEPGDSATVTQALETVAGKHECGATKIGRVEFSVRRQVQGVKYTSPALYSVVKTIKYPY